MPDSNWALQLIAPETACSIRFFFNGLSIRTRKRRERHWIDALVLEPGLICGLATGLPPRRLITEQDIHRENGLEWFHQNQESVLLLQQENRFVLVWGTHTKERALAKANSTLDLDFYTLQAKETNDRKNICNLFSINKRHNPPTALAAETLTARLRERNSTLHGLWSLSDGFINPTFSLNELYPLARAWSLIDPPVALELVQTVLSLQQDNGGFPAWVESNGPRSQAASWPLIVQSFEMAWQSDSDPMLLKKHLPALRKYALLAVRYFDPRRDLIPSWQSEQELFIPQPFEYGKATPDLTVLLLLEMEALLRLHEQHGQMDTSSLAEERDQLVKTLNTVFWNPIEKSFCNVWKDGHYQQEPTFGSFMPLLWRGLDQAKRTAVLERFDETRNFPGSQRISSWEQNARGDTIELPIIHQFMALEALRITEGPLLSFFVHRLREGFTTWFERESIAAVRSKKSNNSAYALGPITAALLLTTQAEFKCEVDRQPATAKKIMHWGHQLKIRKTDCLIVSIVLLSILLVHLFYRIPHSRDEKSRIAAAALQYAEGNYAEALRTCRRYPNSARSQLLQANILLMSERPDQAEELYRQALIQEIGSPSALFGLALSLQMNGNFSQAEKRYGDFLDLYAVSHPTAGKIADTFKALAREGFAKPPGWRKIFALPMMNDLL